MDRYKLSRQQEGAANATINLELSTLRRAFKIAVRSNPPKVRAVPFIGQVSMRNARTGFVEDNDFAKLAAEATELWLRLFLELAYSFGWRKSELLALRVRHVNLHARTIRLDPAMTKNGEGREVVMTQRVRDLLAEAIKDKAPDDFVLSCDGKSVKDFRKAWQNLCVQGWVRGSAPDATAANRR